MVQAPVQSRIVRFGIFTADLGSAELYRAGVRMKLASQPFEVLRVLLEHPQQIVTRRELKERIWPEQTFVDDDLGLRKAIARLREVLDDSAENPRFIETLARKGYRFIAPVTESENGNSPQVLGLPVEHALRPPRPWYSRKSASIPIFLLSVAILVLLLGRYTGKARSELSRNSRPRIQSLVVLPMDNLSADPEQDYFAEGIADALTTDLAQIGGVQVISRTSAVQAKARKWSLPEIGRALNVDAVVEGTVSQAGDRVRITAQLIHAQTDKHLWARSYERNLSDVLALQDEVARDIAQEIQQQINPERQGRSVPARSVKPEAYDAYLQGRYHWNERSPKELQTAIDYFEQSLALDPTYPLSYVGLADSYALLATTRASRPGEVIPKAKQAVLKALAFDDTIAEAHTTLGWVKEAEWDWTGSDAEFRKALELDPNYATAHHRYAQHLAAIGKLPEALAEMRRAQQLDPLSPPITASVGWVLLRSRLPDQALPECQKAIDMDAKFVRGHLCLGEVYEQKQMFEQAAAEFLQGKILAGSDPAAVDALKRAVARDGYVGYFRESLSQLMNKSKKSYVSPYDLADVSIRLGRTEEALKWLEAACEERSPALANVPIEPRLDLLRSDLRFQDIVSRVGLP
jgi:TolB-like protein/DNA-binding winged helix-turn-helix (wHTH) protein